MTAVVGPGSFVESITIGRPTSRRAWRQERPTESHDIFIDQRPSVWVSIKISDRVAQISGTVVADGRPVQGSPVFLWPVSESNRRILGGSNQALWDVSGGVQFNGLPPGEYRLLATFDCSEIAVDLLDESHAPVIRIDAAQTINVELPLWLAP